MNKLITVYFGKDRLINRSTLKIILENIFIYNIATE